MQQIKLFEKKRFYERRSLLFGVLILISIAGIIIFRYYQVNYLSFAAKLLGLTAILLLNKRFFIKETGNLEFDSNSIAINLNTPLKYDINKIRRIEVTADKMLFSLNSQSLLNVELTLETKTYNLLFFLSDFNQKKNFKEFLRILYLHNIEVSEYDSNRTKLYLLKQKKYSLNEK